MAMFDIEELKASKEKRPEKQIREESDRILSVVGGEDILVILDERGEDWDTEKYSEFLKGERDHGKSVTFVIGGAYGFNDAVRERADFLFSLGKKTLPHELCRLVFLEGLYRVLDCGRGGKYHH